RSAGARGRRGSQRFARTDPAVHLRRGQSADRLGLGSVERDHARVSGARARHDGDHRSSRRGGLPGRVSDRLPGARERPSEDHLNGLSFGFAFSAGLIASLNPCAFAMLPAFAAYYLGIDDDRRRLSLPARAARGVAVGATMTAGFVVVFTTIGLLVSLA